MSTDIRPLTIQATDAELQDLKNRLANTRWPEKEPVEDWSQGIPLAYLQEVVSYWENDYDWRKREEKLNRWPGYVTSIDDVDIHFLHIESPESRARPLLMTHGWPGSIVEFQKVIGPLTDPVAHGGNAEDAFHLVCPTLPGYGFSGKPSETGWGAEKIAKAWNTLMVRLGYDSYLAQGGDWGSIVTVHIGGQNLGNCKGIHVTLPMAGPDPESLDDLTEMEQGALASMQFYQDHDSGYSKQQSTRPQTIGYGLADSPAGQAGWIIEKFYQWTDCDGHPENVLTKDELLDNVMMYWLTNSAASSARLYWESFGGAIPEGTIDVPSGISIFPKEIFRTSERWAKNMYSDLRYYNVLDKGGHFAAFEQPELFVEEVRNCFRNIT